MDEHDPTDRYIDSDPAPKPGPRTLPPAQIAPARDVNTETLRLLLHRLRDRL